MPIRKVETMVLIVILILSATILVGQLRNQLYAAQLKMPSRVSCTGTSGETITTSLPVRTGIAISIVGAKVTCPCVSVLGLPITLGQEP